MRKLLLVAWLITACVPAASVRSPSVPPVVTSSVPTTIPPTIAPTVTPTPSPVPTPSPTPTVPPTATPSLGLTRYASAELGYSLDLPSGWRRAACSSGILEVAPFRAAEIFVGVPESEEHISAGARLVVVHVNQAQGLTAVAYLESNASQPDARVEQVTLNGRDAARARIVTTGVTYAFAVAARGWIYHVERPYFGIEDEELRQIISSLRILDDATGRPAATAPPSRTIEALRDAIAESFGKKDLGAISETMQPCVSATAVPGDGGLLSRAAFLKDLASQFAGGLSVVVGARPVENDPNFGSLVRSTWSKPGQPDQRVDFVLQARGDRWSIAGILYRAP